jgi:hypothetical protein
MSLLHVIVKTLSIQNKERILEAAREKHQVTYKGKTIKIATGFSKGTVKIRRAWNGEFQALNKNNCKLRLLCPVKN